MTITPSRSGGALLTVDMARSVRIVGAILLPPNKDSPKYRLVVDMVADGQDQRGAGDAPRQPTPKAKPTTLAALPTSPRGGRRRARPAARALESCPWWSSIRAMVA